MSAPSGSNASDLMVTLTCYLMDPDRGSEHLIGWKWAVALSNRVAQVVAVVPEPVAEHLMGDQRLPSNLELVSAGLERMIDSRLPVPGYHRQYAAFLQDAGKVVADLESDVAHQVNWATPYWGSSLALFRGPKVLGPVGISAPIPPWAQASIPPREALTDLARRALTKWPGPPVSVRAAITSADHVLVVDRRAAGVARRQRTPWSAMLADGASPVPRDQLAGWDMRQDLLWVGRMMPRKAAPLAVRAFAEALPGLPPDARLVMAGDGHDMPAVQRLQRELGLGDRLSLLGSISTAEVRSQLATCRALVFSSLRDSFGGVVLEAAEVGTPVVTALHSGVDGLRNWLPRDAMWGRDVRSQRGFVAGLAQGMVEALQSPQSEWERRSLSSYRFAERHSWERRANQMTEIYVGLC